MWDIQIDDSDFAPLAGKHVVLTGSASGIGLATTKLLLEHGAHVTGGDMNPMPIENANLQFSKLDVTSWQSQVAFFKQAVARQRIDHVYANAGIAGVTTYANLELDGNGDPLEPPTKCYDINLRGMVNTCALGLHYMRKNPEHRTSIVLTASCSSFQRFRGVDYAATKHGILGFMRGMVPIIQATKLPIRINSVAPSWTATGLSPDSLLDRTGLPWQWPSAVARAVCLLMADEHRNGQCIVVHDSKYKDIEEPILLKAVDEILEGDEDNDSGMVKIVNAAIDMIKEGGGNTEDPMAKNLVAMAGT